MSTSIVYYFAPFSSASPVTSALLELGVPHERVQLDLARGDQRTPEHLARNPNGRVPTLVVDGTPMFEALAILQWLGDRFGVERGLWPAADSPDRLAAMSWSAWAYVTYGAVTQRLWLTGGEHAPDALRNQAHADHARADLQRLLGILDGRLADRAYLLNERFSLLDLVVGCVVGYGAMLGGTVDPHPRAKAWLERVQARPSMRAEWG